MLRVKEFYTQTIKEIGKIAWCSKQEVVTTTIFVFIMVIVSSLFFLLVDSVIYRSIQYILDFGG
jgi:preprotein translocase subunit SecE